MANPVPTAALVPVSSEPAPIVKAVSSDALRDALTEYRRVQEVLDVALPDCIMRISGRSFRKKNYWRAVTTAFNLDVVVESEERIEAGDDWGYVITYRATAPNGRSATGDGACMRSEKKGAQGTLHNIRSHAHTRAYNRAVSNLVGFGEVSAEEVEHEPEPPRRQEPPRPAAPERPAHVQGLAALITARKLPREDVLRVLGAHGYTALGEVPASDAEAIGTELLAIADAYEREGAQS